MGELVVDLSHHNVIPESLKPAYEYGIRGVIHKVTEGTTFIDSKYKARRSLANDAGMLWGVYHFIRPGNIEQQVDFFVQQCAPVMDKNTLFALDYEDPKVSLDDVFLFLLLLQEQTNCFPVLYSGHVLKEKMLERPLPSLTKYRLWLAQYADNPELPAGWNAYFLWQFTSNGQVAGINPPTDLNQFEGDLEDLKLEWAQEATPEDDDKVVHIIAPRGVEIVVHYPKGDVE